MSEVMNVIGEVKDKVAVLVDDMIDTAGRFYSENLVPLTLNLHVQYIGQAVDMILQIDSSIVENTRGFLILIPEFFE